MTLKSGYVNPKIAKVIELYQDILQTGYYSLPVKQQLRLLSDRLLEAHKNGNDSVCFQIGSWHPGLVGKSDARILESAFSREDAVVTIAREHGFSEWGEVEDNGTVHSDEVFERAIDTMLAGDLVALKDLVATSPNLVRNRSSYGHQATLLHYAGANGVESYRQVVPLNLAQIVEFLLASGSDPNSTANIYGGSTFLDLFSSSKHPYEARIDAAVLSVLKAHQSRSEG